MSTTTNLLQLLVRLDELGLTPVRHRGFIGLKGKAVSRVPAAVWKELARNHAGLVRHLRNEPGPYRRRQQGAS